MLCNSPRYTPLHATHYFVGPHTLLQCWRTEFQWELKNTSHKSKFLFALVNRNQTRIHSCLTKPIVTLICDSYFWALMKTLSIMGVRGCKDQWNNALRALWYSTVCLCSVVRTRPLKFALQHIKWAVVVWRKWEVYAVCHFAILPFTIRAYFQSYRREIQQSRHWDKSAWIILNLSIDYLFLTDKLMASYKVP